MAEERLVEEFGAAVLAQPRSGALLAEQLCEVVQSAVSEVASSDDFDGFDGFDGLESLELELRLWDLVASITSKRGVSIVDKVARFLPKLEALEDMPSIKWEHTQTNNTQTYLDSDAPLREGTQIDSEDAKTDNEVFKYVFGLVLRGDFSAASETCRRTGNWPMKTAIDASQVSKLTPSVLDAVNALSTSPVSEHERGVYGLLGGNISAVSPLCQSWEELLLAYIRTDTDLALFAEETRQNPQFSEGYHDFHRQICFALICGEFSEYCAAKTSEPDFSLAAYSTSFVRVLLHVQMALQCVTEPVVQLYVVHLCSDPANLAQRLQYIPRYIAELPEPQQPRVYGQVLAELISPNEIQQQIALSREFGVDLEACLAHAVDLSFELYSANANDAFVASRLVRCIATVLDAKLADLSLLVVLKAFKTFFTNDDVAGASILVSVLDLDLLKESCFRQSQTGGYAANVLNQLDQIREFETLVSACRGLDQPAHEQTAAQAAETRDAVLSALSFSGPESVRAVYIPKLVYGLLKFVSEIEPRIAGFSSVVTTLVEKLADERLLLYKYFDGGLMQALADPYLAAT